MPTGHFPGRLLEDVLDTPKGSSRRLAGLGKFAAKGEGAASVEHEEVDSLDTPRPTQGNQELNDAGGGLKWDEDWTADWETRIEIEVKSSI